MTSTINAEKAPKRRGSGKGVIALVVIALCLLLAGPGLLAQGLAMASPDIGIGSQPVVSAANPAGGQPASSAPQSPDDDGIRKFGVEWINTYPTWPDGNVDGFDDTCNGFFTNMVFAPGWIPSLYYSENDVYQTDFKKETNGGHEDQNIDSVDIAMLCTHGGRNGDAYYDGKLLTAPIFPGDHDSVRLSPGDAVHSYGDHELEWLAFDSCSVLANKAHTSTVPKNYRYWYQTFNGLHLMLGFKNTMYLVQPGDGPVWAAYMMGAAGAPATVLQSWFWAVDYNQYSGVCARVLAEVNNNYNDHLTGFGYVSPDPTHDNYAWYWDHCSGETGLAQEAPQKIAQVTNMPVLEVVARTVNPAYVNEIADTFGFSGTLSTFGQFYGMTDPTGTKSLLVDSVNGGFAYHDLARLGVPPTTTLMIPSADSAMTIANNFFNETGLGLPGVENRALFSYSIDELTQEVVTATLDGLDGQTLAITPTNGTVTYGRLVSVTVGTDTGPQTMWLPVAGAGAKLILYLGDHGAIIGAQGGTRDVQVSTRKVTIMTADEAWALYEANHKIALDQISIPSEVFTRTAETLGYYERPQVIDQATLVPVWIFTVDYGDGETAKVNVPAANVYLPPQVQINSPVDGSIILPGELLNLSGSVVQGGNAPFTYTWTASGQATPLGNGADLVASLNTIAKAGAISSQTITLTVTDANGQQGTATITVYVLDSVYLPLIPK